MYKRAKSSGEPKASFSLKGTVRLNAAQSVFLSISKPAHRTIPTSLLMAPIQL